MIGASEKVKFGLWGAGVLAVFLFHLLALVDAGVGGGENAALIWSILLLIAAPVGVVALIGGGFVRGSGRGGPESGDRRPESNAERGTGREG